MCLSRTSSRPYMGAQGKRPCAKRVVVNYDTNKITSKRKNMNISVCLEKDNLKVMKVIFQ